MAENRKESETGLYYLNKSQLVLVTGGFVLSSFLVFLLGIVVGQGIEERKLLKQEEPLVKVPIQPPAAPVWIPNQAWVGPPATRSAILRVPRTREVWRCRSRRPPSDFWRHCARLCRGSLRASSTWPRPLRRHG